MFFRFCTGPSVVQSTIPMDVKHLVLILNGREPNKIKFAKDWLDILPHLPQLENAGLVILGNEQCNNEWLYPYLSKNGGLLKFVFLTYDSYEVDNVNIFQWPLGVAT